MNYMKRYTVNKSKLTFKSISAKNFKSIGNYQLDLVIGEDRTLITSDENGSGKSTLLVWALFYALYDKPYNKKSKKAGMINDINDKDMLVTVEFNAKGKDYKLRRGAKPKVFDVLVSKDGEYVPINDRPTQDDLLDIIGLDDSIFQFVVCLGADRYVPFFEMDASARREVNEKFIDLSVVSLMGKRNKDDLKSINLDIKHIEQHMLPDTNNTIERINASIKQLETLNGEHVASIKESIKSSEIAIQRLEQDIIANKSEQELANNRLAPLLEKLDNLASEKQKEVDLLKDDGDILKNEYKTSKFELDEKLKKVKNKVSKFTDKIKEIELISSRQTLKKDDLESEIEHFKHLDHCTTCKQDVAQSTKDKIRTENEIAISEIDVKLTQCSSNIGKLSKVIESLSTEESNVLSELESLKSCLDVKENELRTNVDEIREKYNDLMVDLKNESNVLSNQLDVLSRDVSKLENQINEKRRLIDKMKVDLNNVKGDEYIAQQRSELDDQIKTQTELNDKLKGLYDKSDLCKNVAEVLSDDGFKSVMFKRYLPFFNSNVNRILEAMGLYINFEMTEDYKININNPIYKNRGLYDLSSGQKCRINLAILLTWREIARQRSSVDTNLLILDEVLESLSKNGVGDFMDMASKQLAGYNTFVITQRGDEFVDHFDHRINFKLIDDFTTMEYMK